MTQNIVSLTLSDTQLQAVDAALTELETQLSGLIAVPLAQKRSLRKMGEKSEAFCRQAMRVLEQNPQLAPPNLVAAAPLEDLTALDQLRPRMVRLARLSERAADTDLALGSDVMDASLKVYGLLKLTGRSEGLDGLRREMGIRFARSKRPAETPEAEAA
jgi:hypothetical protein